MHARLSRRLGAPASGIAALLVAGGLWASPAAAAPSLAPPPTALAGPVLAAVPPQEPGVTLRVFDLQVNLANLCTLKPAQTPNVDKLMPTINFTTAADFGFADQFYSQVIANLNVPTAGSYDFRLISDDGSRLTIDDQTVIEHDGTHAATPKDGSRTLTAGYHALRIDHFDAQGGQQLTLQWKPPGAAGFVTVPTSALSTDAGIIRVTAPGKKECEGSGDQGGDGLPLTGVHPNYTLTNLRGPGFEPKVTGLDFFPDGRMALSTWANGQLSQNGEVWVLGNVTGNTTPGAVTRTRIAQGLKEPMGVKVVDGKVYVAEKHRLTRLDDTNGDGVTDTYTSIATWPHANNFHEFGFGLIYKDGFFYLSLSVALNYNGNSLVPQPASNRGTTLKVNKNTGAVEYIAGGLRTPHGIGFGPEDGIFVTDNQGDWLPSSKLLHVKPGRYFNHPVTPAGPYDNNPVTPPVLWMPQNEIANSPSQPFMLSAGPFAGQMVIGDVTYGGLQRAYLEKVGGEYQGALFRMTQGLEAGVSRVVEGPDGALYVGGIGYGGNWGQPGKLQYGLQKLTPTSTNAFDILAMRAKPGGFEFEYTKPVSEATGAGLASKYTFQQWRYTPTAGYGGPKVGQENLNVTSAVLSADRKKVTVQVAGLKTGYVVHARTPRPFTSTTGDSLWSTEAWYTLNSLVTDGPVDPGPSTVYQAESAALGGGAGVSAEHAGYTGTGFVDRFGAVGASATFTVNAASAGARDVTLRYANGPNPFTGTKTVSLYVNGTKVRQVPLATTGSVWATWGDRTESVTLNAGNNTIMYRVDSGDTGHVNLDKITVASGAPVTTTLQAEDAARSGGAQVSSQHAGYTGTGFVETYGATGSTTTFTVNAASAGARAVTVRYANGGWPTVGAKTLSLYVNGAKLKQVSLAPTANWSTWAEQTETVTLTAGNNTIAYKIDSGDSGFVNLDRITVAGGDGGGDPNPNRITLFDGSNLSAWERPGGGPADWPIAGGSAEVVGGDIQTKQKFLDFKLHVEFLVPQFDSSVTGQQRGNSGVYLQDRYEVQVLDSYGDTTLSNDEAGAIYRKHAPSSNQATAPNTWQTYEITFRAPRFNGSGIKTENARATVVWNGVTVHNNVQINGSTDWGDPPESAAPGSIRLQDHFDPGPNVRYRNIWIEPMG